MIMYFGLAALVIALVAVLAPKMADGMKDVTLKIRAALPNGAATAYATLGEHSGNVNWLLTAPEVNTIQCPNGKTIKYSILTDSVDPIDGSSTVLMTDVITQTGAGGAGAAAATYRFRLPPSAGRILGFKVVGSTSGDASGVSATLEAVA